MGLDSPLVNRSAGGGIKALLQGKVKRARARKAGGFVFIDLQPLRITKPRGYDIGNGRTNHEYMIFHRSDNFCHFADGHRRLFH